MRLDGVVVAIRGGARGIGQAIARRLAEEGAGVAIGDIDSAGAAATAARIRTGGGRATGLAVDVTARRSIQAFVGSLSHGALVRSPAGTKPTVELGNTAL